MKLHEAIEKLLKEKGRSLTTSEIADELNRNKWYSKRDGSLITAYQIHGRTRNYPHLFKRDGILVALINQPLTKSKIKVSGKKPIKIIRSDNKISIKSVEKELMVAKRFKKAGIIDSIVPTYPGLYCLRITNPAKLPRAFSEELRKREHNIIYIGKATQSLKRRLVNQELRARGHGTFFRSIGSILGYKPPKGSLVNKKNKINFKFYLEDENRIISWINENLLINWIVFSGDIPKVESELIAKYKPLLNLDGIPWAMEELRLLRAQCLRIANKVD